MAELPEVKKPEDVGVCSERIGRVAELCHRYVDDKRLVGTQVVVTRRGEVVLNDTYGYADAENNKPVAADTIWRIYSMTKPVTSVALMMLVEEGRLRLEQPMSDFIPEYADAKVWAGGDETNFTVVPAEREPTVHDMLTHMSGVTAGFIQAHPLDALYRTVGLGNFTRPEGNLEQGIALLAQQPLLFQPGTRWNYGMSTDVVGRIVEVVSGQPLDRFFADHIFEPLGMTDTGFHLAPELASRFSAMYTRGPDGAASLIESSEKSGYFKEAQFFSGAGGLVSTARDYHRFIECLAQGGELDGVRLLGPKTIDYMALNHLPGGATLNEMGQSLFSETSMEGIGFGLGFGVVVDPPAVTNLCSKGEYHWGGAASTTFWIDPVEELHLQFYTQLLPSSTYPIRRELRSTVYQALLN